jgi:hypothetical protein
MKTRSGFVSNSSSTSFTIIVRKDDFDKVQTSLPKNVQKLMDQAWSNPPRFIVEEKVLFDLSYIDQDGGYWQEMGEYVANEDGEKLDREEAYELGKEIIMALKNKGAYIREQCC